MATENVTIPRKVGRESRKPFGSSTQKLAYPSRPGYHRHWFNFTPGRIEEALEAGYTHVEDKEGRKVNRVVGTDNSGAPLMGYLMEIPEEWYKEDMAAQQVEIDKVDNAIRTGAVEGKPGEDGRYVPEHRGIRIKDTRGR